MSDVKVYLWDGDCMDCGGGPYFMEQPMSTVGDWLRNSEQRAFMVPEETRQRWRAAARAREQMETEIATMIERRRQEPDYAQPYR